MHTKLSAFYRNNEKVLKLLYIFFFFSIVLVWALVQPFDSCPDERMRYVIPQYIFNNNALPNANDMSIIDSSYGFSYAAQPMLPYIFSAVFMKITSVFTTASYPLLIAARMTSVLSSIGYAVFIIKTSKLAFDRTYKQWLFILLCTMWPQLSFVFTYVNCDGMAMFSVSIVVYYWFKVFKEGISYKNCFGISVGMAIGILSYLNVYIYSLLSLVLYVCYYIFVNDSPNKWKDFFKYAFVVCGFVLLFTGWHFIRNMVLYDGNILARGVNKYGELYGIDGFKPSQRAEAARKMMSTISGKIHWINSTVISFIGMFGYMSISLSKVVYVAYLAETAVGTLGSLIAIIKNKFRVFKKRHILKYVLGLSIVGTVIMSYIYSLKDYQPQGRYIMPAIIPLCYFIAYGISFLINRSSAKIQNTVVACVGVVNVSAIIYSLCIIFINYLA